jgi:hypothetical protein
VPEDGFGEEMHGRVLVPLLPEEKINGLASLIDGAIEIVPPAFGFDIRLIHPPAQPHRPFAAVEGRF